MFIALAWGLQLVPLLYLTSINTYDRALANAASGFFVLGSGIAVLDFLLNAGTIQVLDWMTRDFLLNAQDWRSLEITYMVSRSRNLWLLTVDWLFMALGLWCIAMFIKRSLPSECRDHLGAWANVSEPYMSSVRSNLYFQPQSSVAATFPPTPGVSGGLNLSADLFFEMSWGEWQEKGWDLQVTT